MTAPDGFAHAAELLRLGANLNAKDTAGRSALAYAKDHSPEIAHLITAAGGS